VARADAGRIGTVGEQSWQRVRRGVSRHRISSLYGSGSRARSTGTTVKAKVNQRAYKVSKISIIVLAILIPVFAEYGFIPGFEESRAFLVGAAAGVIVLLEGLQVLNKWQENWILYRATCEGLRNEQHLFAEMQALTPISGQRRRRGCWPSGRAAWSWPSIPNGPTPARTRSRRRRGSTKAIPDGDRSFAGVQVDNWVNPWDVT